MYSEVKKFSNQHSDEIRIFAALFLLFAVFAHWNGAPDNSRYDLTKSMVENHSLSIDPYKNNTYDRSLIDGHSYSDKAPLASIMAIPGYIIGKSITSGSNVDDPYLITFKRTYSNRVSFEKYFMTVTVSGFSGALSAVLIYLIFLARGIERNRSMILSLLTGLGTMIFPYSTNMQGTMLGTMFLLLAIFLWIRKNSRRYHLAIFGSLGLGVSTSYLIAIPAAFIGLMTYKEEIRNLEISEEMVYGAVGGVLGLLPLLVYNTFIFGHPFDITMFYNVINPTGLSAAREGLVNPTSFNLSPAFMLSKIVRILFYPGYGLLLFSPVLCLAFYGLYKDFKESDELAFITLGSFIVSLLFISTLTAWGDGSYYSARYLLPTSTLVFLSLPRAMNRRYLFAALSTLSIFLMSLSTQSWVDPRVTFEKAYAVMLTPQPLTANLFSTYIPRAATAYQSPILSYLLGFTSELNLVISNIPNRTVVIGQLAGSILYYNNQLLFLGLGIGIITLFFFREIQDIFGTKKVYYLIVLLVLISALGFSQSTRHYENWYPQKSGESFHWARNDPSIYIYAENNATVLLDFQGRSYRRKEFNLTLNDKPVIRSSIGPDKQTYITPLKLKKGVNRLGFDTTGRCDVIGRFSGNHDKRCTTLGIANFSIGYPSQNMIFGNNITNSSGKIYLRNNGTMVHLGEMRYRIELDGRAIGNYTPLTVYQNGDPIGHTNFTRFGQTFTTPFIQGEGIDRITFQTKCHGKCKEIELTGLKTISEDSQPEDLLYTFGSNWYEKIESEDYRWSNGNSTIYIYNYGEEPKNRILWISAKTFNSTRNVTYSLNGDVIGNKDIRPTDYKVQRT
ncbi:MAG: hypothetical protein ABEJ99_06015, partial [Candidatus Nanohaloarchaea archaeon]